MSGVLRDIKPSKVFYYFEELSKIPRCSGDEKNVSNYLVSFAKENNLEVIQDEALNVIIKKPGTKGYESSPTVILQGHMDMVCEKNKGTEHDFCSEPLDLRIDGDFVKATGTTLGADNGIAVAYAMAILGSDDIPHPPLEVLITSEEETGMGGANKVHKENLLGKILINIDSEEEGVLLVSCAGGVRNKIKLPIEWENIDRGTNPYILTVRGLRGGHSGMEINKQRGNSNKILGRILFDLNESFDISVYEVNGGAKMNAIPREADAKIIFNSNEFENINSKIEEWNDILTNELKSVDPDIKIALTEMDEKPNKIFSKDTVNKLITLYRLIPNGIQSMSMDIEGLVQSSTNIGVVTTFDKQIVFESAIRSSVRTLKQEILNRQKALADIIGAEMTPEADYPEWQYDPNSYIRGVFVESYKDMFGNEPEISAIHAGLECGLFKEKLGDVDMISFGPNMYDVHTPEEALSISSTERMWNYLVSVLERIK
ncbi:aminoacyl-histidine dipeptidase [Clostridium sp. D2Q-11]|uniref:Cytosol non-specific dipeptidase n=1 Tax=Anaeromonas frigoriresistens TaxID=2683708 RepID=A0A942V1P1_9FIRM|nr:aminoacyl-histidine dipeptidase [Anaeromonas frigoriresistens]MBS4539547.1 aminoacyl-histidine dipeptidase [Anaeromonas frigoriresistens]